MESFRTEQDALGKISIPSDALWGAATGRAIKNFPISSRRFPSHFIAMLGRIKAAAAKTNQELGLIEDKFANAIISAAYKVADGEHYDQFPLDVFQTGSGTSINMNANEVIANLANASLGKDLGTWDPVHPNDHVNLCQSSNDVIPSVIHLATVTEIDRSLIPALVELRAALASKARAFDSIIKIGRTHLQDAMPIRLGQEFAGYARQVEKCIERLRRMLPSLCELALGGTAVGTGAGAHHDFAASVCDRLSAEFVLDFRPAASPFEALASRAPCVEASGCLAAAAICLMRIADDIRLLASGPRLGLGELKLPALQPGSSIMPGKVNPVIPEMVCQVGSQVIGNNAAVIAAASQGHLQLNTQLPVIAANILESIQILTAASHSFSEHCVTGIEADEARCASDVEKSLALAMALVPKIGYARAAEIAGEAASSGRTIREVALHRGVAGSKELDELLQLERLTYPGI
ncbi:MAG: class II fumarate hydratase [Pseudomonadota bacterium]